MATVEDLDDDPSPVRHEDTLLSPKSESALLDFSPSPLNARAKLDGAFRPPSVSVRPSIKSELIVNVDDDDEEEDDFGSFSRTRLSSPGFTNRSRRKTPHPSKSPVYADHVADDLDDDEDDRGGEVDPLLDSSIEKEKEEKDFLERIRSWDVFRVEPWAAEEYGVSPFFDNAMKVLKVGVIILSFLIILIGVLIGKGTIFIAASQLRPDIRLVCLESETDIEKNITQCTVVTNTFNMSNTYWTSGDKLHCIGADTTSSYLATPCFSITARWIWCLLMMIISPDILIFLKSIWRITFKSEMNPTLKILIVAMFMESLQVCGVCLLVFRVLPSLTSSGEGVALLAGTAFIPAVLNLFNISRDPNKEGFEATLTGIESKTMNKTLLKFAKFVALLIQLGVIILYPILIASQGYGQNAELNWSAPVSVVLIGSIWWINYVDHDSRLGAFGDTLRSIKKEVKRYQTKLYMVISLYKIALAIALMSFFVMDKYEGTSYVDVLNFLFSFAESQPDICPSISWGEAIGQDILADTGKDWIWVWLINIMSGYSVYFAGRIAAKVHIQIASYASPLTIATPAALGLMIGLCDVWNSEPCFISSFIPSHLFWICPVSPGENSGNIFLDNYAWLGFVIWISQIILALHIWNPKNEVLAKTEKLFLLPLFNNITLEQWMLYNRNRKDAKSNQRLVNKQKISEIESPLPLSNDDVNTSDYHDNEIYQVQRGQRLADETPFIYLSATMWHENEEEMMQMLRSIFRLDIDQCVKRHMREDFGIEEDDFYEFEVHVFFDDAIGVKREGKLIPEINDFVKILCRTINKAASAVHGVNMELDPPKRIPTPYGGRLVWILPGENLMVVHLKDKAKIRHKKRWSRVMYMYYFLGYQLWKEKAGMELRTLRARNTYILALDGDIDFQPRAVKMLIDLMKRNIWVGAACGRIHPIGFGPLLWYQKFEYALGHWMQKATEHVLGCVLCSPGCFSLFRAEALMSPNVMNQYTKKSEKPVHFLQYDQGEDRWLCTLLLQAGYRVEYSAASDSFTYAPEAFEEFYNQRRRWMPSTMANIVDLLLSARMTVKKNQNISSLYIAYQTVILISSLLGTGSIFLMIVGALTIALNNAISNWESLLINLIPIVIFIIICLSESKLQLPFAKLLTVGYAVIQMVVLVGIIIQISEDGPSSPTAVFFFFVTGVFVIAGILHPKEIGNLFHGFIYFLVIPSMYMLLMIYSITNIHVVSWGTREVVQTKTEEQEEKERELLAQQEAEKKKTQREKLLDMFARAKNVTEEGFILAAGSLFRCIYCPREVEKPDPVSIGMQQINSKLHEVHGDVKDIRDATVVEKKHKRFSKTASSRRSVHFATSSILKEYSSGNESISSDDDQELGTTSAPVTERADVHRDDLINPLWIEDEVLGKGNVVSLGRDETVFFQDLVKKYLYPLDKNVKEEERQAMELKELRNKASFAFFFMNALFVVTIFTMQGNVDKISVAWPWGQDLRLEPIGFMFLIFFGIILIFQTFGMIVHRMGTVLHLLSRTKLKCCGNDLSDENLTPEQAYKLVMDFAKLRPEQLEVGPDDYQNDSDQEFDGFAEQRKRHQSVVQKIECDLNKGQEPVRGRLSTAINKRTRELEEVDSDDEESLEKLGQELGYDKKNLAQRRKSMAALKTFKHRRSTIVRKSKFKKSLGTSETILDEERTRTKRFNGPNGSIRSVRSDVAPTVFKQDAAPQRDINFSSMRNPFRTPKQNSAGMDNLGYEGDETNVIKENPGYITPQPSIKKESSTKHPAQGGAADTSTRNTDIVETDL